MPHGPVDYPKRRPRARAYLPGGKTGKRVGQRLHAGDEDRQMGGQGARHDGVDSYLLHRRLSPAGYDPGHEMVRRQVGPGKHLGHRLLSRRYKRQTVSPAALVEKVVHFLERAFEDNP